MVHTEPLQSPAVTMAPSGEDSLLVYTYENILYHYVIKSSDSVISLVRVGQIGLHGIVRAPARVRAVTWHIPDHQLSLYAQLMRPILTDQQQLMEILPKMSFTHR